MVGGRTTVEAGTGVEIGISVGSAVGITTYSSDCGLDKAPVAFPNTGRLVAGGTTVGGAAGAVLGCMRVWLLFGDIVGGDIISSVVPDSISCELSFSTLGGDISCSLLVPHAAILHNIRVEIITRNTVCRGILFIAEVLFLQYGMVRPYQFNLSVSYSN